jgi:hypothetical protein
MPKANLCSTAAASSLLVLSWTLAAGAQQQPGTNVPTQRPPPAAGELPGAARMAPVLPEPVIDPSTTRSTLPNTPLLVTGLVLFGATYGTSVVAGALSDRDSDRKLYYPVVGPWMSLDERDCSAQPCNNKTLGTVLLVGSGALQGLGAVSMLMSLFIPSKSTHHWYLIGNEDTFVAPLVGSDQLGAVAVGSF